MVSNEDAKLVVSAAEKFLGELDAMAAVAETVVSFDEADMPEKRMPVVWKGHVEGYKVDEESESKLREFFSDPSNRSRLIFCREINNDPTDGYGMFGYSPGFIFITSRNYEGAETFADQGALQDQSIKKHPNLGIGMMNHYDYFPKMKLNTQTISQYESPSVYRLLVDILFPKKMDGGVDGGLLAHENV